MPLSNIHTGYSFLFLWLSYLWWCRDLWCGLFGRRVVTHTHTHTHTR